MKLNWHPEAAGMWAPATDAGDRGLTFSMSGRGVLAGNPTEVRLSMHRGDGRWINCGTYPTITLAAAAAEFLADKEMKRKIVARDVAVGIDYEADEMCWCEPGAYAGSHPGCGHSLGTNAVLVQYGTDQPVFVRAECADL